MKTEIFKMSDNCIDIEGIKKCAQIIKSGGLVAFPTETVYGLGASAFDAKACERIYEVKNRPPMKALTCHIYDISQAYELAYVSAEAEKLIKAFFPGPLTIVLPKKDTVSDFVTANYNTVAIRMPQGELISAFLRECNVPVAAPSANISGQPAPSDAEPVIRDFCGKIEAVIDSGKTQSGVPSTIVSLVEGSPVILREGIISKSEIDNILKG